MLRTIAIISLAFALSGCQALGEAAYDLRTDKDESRCNALLSHNDRQACMARVREVEKQAAVARKPR